MSFILDALKKSDAKRRAQLGPDLATPTAPVAPSSSRHTKPIMVWGLIGLFVVFVIGGAVVWFVLDQGELHGDVSGAQPVATRQTGTVDANDGADNPPPNLPAEPMEIVQEPISGVSSEASTPAAPSQPAVEEVASVAEASLTNQPASALPTPAPASVEALEARLAAVSESESQTEAVGDVEQAAEASGTESLGEADEPGEAWQPQAADYLYQWELPLSVRQSLPTLNLLVHVYSKLPDDRFVLINGTRFREGDELSPGVRLAEIRPEGALIDFRDYRFLLSQ